MRSICQGAREMPGMTSNWVADDLDSAALKDAIERAGQCLAIATAQGADGSLVGARCAAQPALLDTVPVALAWTLAHDAPGLPVFTHATHVALNFFAVQDVDTDTVDRRFAGPGNNKFSKLAFEFGLGGAPLLEGTVATFECENRLKGMADSPGCLQFIAVVRRYRQVCSSNTIKKPDSFNGKVSSP